MIGQRVGQYRIIRKIGQGGMGVVYEAVHEQLNLRAAVKVLYVAFAQDSAQAGRFLDEARAASAVQHTSLVRLFDFGQLPDGTLYMMMEYLDGETLRERLLRNARRLGAEQALPLCRQVASALTVVHEAGIVHRDLTPANIMLVPDREAPGGERAKLLDFGIARFLQDEASYTVSGMVVGTPRYMSPEQCAGAPLDAQSDVYSLGIILFESLIGQWPYSTSASDRQSIMRVHLQEKARSLRQALPDAPRELAALIGQMLAKDAAMRPAMAKVAERLALLCESAPGTGARGELDQVPGRSPGATETGAAMALRPSEQPLSTLAPTVAPSRRSLMRPTSTWGQLGLYGGMLAAALTLAGGLSWLRSSRPTAPARISGMAYLPGGSFWMGSTLEEIEAAYQVGVKLEPESTRSFYEREQPRRKVHVSPFYLDEKEVTNEDFARWLNMSMEDTTIREEYEVYRGAQYLVSLHQKLSGIKANHGKYELVAGLERQPVTQVTWTGAMLYCQTQGKRLPTEAEWEYAARGGGELTHPWGDGLPVCDRVAFGHAAGQECPPVWTHPPEVGTMPMDRSPQGVLDLGGSVKEWVLDQFVLLYPDCGACRDPVVEKGLSADSRTPFRVARGGSFWESSPPTRAASRSRWPENLPSKTIGFRCAIPVSH